MNPPLEPCGTRVPGHFPPPPPHLTGPPLSPGLMGRGLRPGSRGCRLLGVQSPSGPSGPCGWLFTLNKDLPPARSEAALAHRPGEGRRARLWVPQPPPWNLPSPHPTLPAWQIQHHGPGLPGRWSDWMLLGPVPGALAHSCLCSLPVQGPLTLGSMGPGLPPQRLWRSVHSVSLPKLQKPNEYSKVSQQSPCQTHQFNLSCNDSNIPPCVLGEPPGWHTPLKAEACVLPHVEAWAPKSQTGNSVHSDPYCCVTFTGFPLLHFVFL